ncbi:hypothetical protein AC578_922 [Pseudocercospora eumusae]|uniref:Uncharacterized protein n=1 Tax=Pseudocercospora eumusae TaxID=321146 RepID=A0A139HBV1_9PEZI|nr:hypothetical protein AC578_922 [Pseudocercospora eumusae]
MPISVHPLGYYHDANDHRMLYSSPLRLNPWLDMTGCATMIAPLSELVKDTAVSAVRVTSRPAEYEIKVGIHLRKWSENGTPAFFESEESWRRTLVSETPITKLEIQTGMTISNEEGLNLGDLDLAWEALGMLAPEEAVVTLSVVAPPTWVLCDSSDDYESLTTCYVDT